MNKWTDERFIATYLVVLGVWTVLIVLATVGFLSGCTAKPPPDLSTVPGPDNTVYVSPTIIRPKGL